MMRRCLDLVRRTLALTAVAVYVVFLALPIPIVDARIPDESNIRISRRASEGYDYLNGNEGTYSGYSSSLSTSGGTSSVSGTSSYYSSPSGKSAPAAPPPAPKKGLFGGLWDKGTQAIGSAKATVTKAMSDVKESVTSAVSYTVSAASQSVARVKDALGEIGSTVNQAARGARETVATAVRNTVNDAKQAVTTAAEQAVVGVKSATNVKEAFSAVTTAATKAKNDVVAAAKTNAAVAAVKVGATVATSFDSVKQSTGRIVGEAKSIAGTVANAYKNTKEQAKVIVSNAVAELKYTAVTTAQSMVKTAASSVYNTAVSIKNTVAAGAVKTWEAIKPAAQWLGKAATKTANVALDILTGADIEKWKNIKNWTAGDWAWVAGNTALTAASFFFPPLASTKVGTAARVAGKAVTSVAGKTVGTLATKGVSLVARVAPKVAKAIPVAAGAIAKAAGTVATVSRNVARPVAKKIAPHVPGWAKTTARAVTGGLSAGARAVVGGVATALRSTAAVVRPIAVTASKQVAGWALKIAQTSAYRGTSAYASAVTAQMKSWLVKDGGLRSFGNLLKRDPRNPLIEHAPKLLAPIVDAIPAPVKTTLAKVGAAVTGLSTSVAKSVSNTQTWKQIAESGVGVALAESKLTIWHGAEALVKGSLIPLASGAEKVLKSNKVLKTAATNPWVKGAANVVVSFRERKVFQDFVPKKKELVTKFLDRVPQVSRAHTAAKTQVEKAMSIVARPVEKALSVTRAAGAVVGGAITKAASDVKQTVSSAFSSIKTSVSHAVTRALTPPPPPVPKPVPKWTPAASVPTPTPRSLPKPTPSPAQLPAAKPAGGRPVSTAVSAVSRSISTVTSAVKQLFTPAPKPVPAPARNWSPPVKTASFGRR